MSHDAGEALAAGSARVLQYPELLEHLAGYTQTPMGAEKIRTARLLVDLGAVEARQDRIAEMRELAARNALVGLGQARPIAAVLAVAATEGVVLDAKQLLDVAGVVRAAHSLTRAMRSAPEERPRLAALAAPVPDLGALADQIERLLTPEGDVRDNASTRLTKLRGRSSRQRSRIKKRLEAMTREERYGTVLQEPLVTQRGGRYVVPVRSGRREGIPGVVHDTSSTGQTVYVEPLEVLEQQNELTALLAQEAEEIRRLFAEVTGHVRAVRDGLASAESLIAEADALQGIARWAQESEAVRPTFTEGGLKLRGGRHPLMERDRFVPLDLEVDDPIRGVVITGPNTGGKTVVIKTVGLLAAMAQAGLPVTAADYTMPLFPRIHADIGDEQSIAQNLSTFSAHLTHVVGFVADCPDSTLVLLDELGTGTDPAEGAALGIALAERFLQQGAFLLVSTHHDALKGFAHGHERAVNAAMEFDSATLAPTYRMRVGRPGRSNAFEIAARLGLDGALVGRARSLLGAESVHLDDVLRRLEQETVDTAAEQTRLQGRQEELAEQLRRVRAADERREREFERLRQEARAELDAALEEVRAHGSAKLRELDDRAPAASRRAQADRRAEWSAGVGAVRAEATGRLQSRLRDLGRSVRQADGGGDADAGSAAASGSPAELSRGQSVEVAPFGLRGVVLREWKEAGEDADVEVDVRGKRMRVRPEQIRVLAGGPRRSSRSKAHSDYGLGRSVAPEVHVRRMRVEEAIATVDKYLDDATLADLGVVRIIHGYGTLALRDALHEWLRDRPGVVEFGAADPGEGGAGVTVVRLRD